MPDSNDTDGKPLLVLECDCGLKAPQFPHEAHSRARIVLSSIGRRHKKRGHEPYLRLVIPDTDAEDTDNAESRTEERAHD
jgi:hypothetical protein